MNVQSDFQVRNVTVGTTATIIADGIHSRASIGISNTGSVNVQIGHNASSVSGSNGWVILPNERVFITCKAEIWARTQSGTAGVAILETLT
jgi:hypothetical protein